MNTPLGEPSDKFRGLPFFYESIESIRGSLKGNRGVVIASGPSMNPKSLMAIGSQKTTTIAVNEEGHRNDFQPDYWIFSDVTFMDRVIRRGYDCPPRTQMIVNERCIQWAKSQGRSLPHSDKPILTFTTTDSITKNIKGKLPFRATTSAAAIWFLVMAGIEDLWLTGVDCCFLKGKGYYRYNRPWTPSLDGSLPYQGDVLMTPENIKMISGLTKLKTEIAENYPEARIFQGCEHSPLECFEKKDLKSWLTEEAD